MKGWGLKRVASVKHGGLCKLWGFEIHERAGWGKFLHVLGIDTRGTRASEVDQILDRRRCLLRHPLHHSPRHSLSLTHTHPVTLALSRSLAPSLSFSLSRFPPIPQPPTPTAMPISPPHVSTLRQCAVPQPLLSVRERIRVRESRSRALRPGHARTRYPHAPLIRRKNFSSPNTSCQSTFRPDCRSKVRWKVAPAPGWLARRRCAPGLECK